MFCKKYILLRYPLWKIFRMGGFEWGTRSSRRTPQNFAWLSFTVFYSERIKLHSCTVRKHWRKIKLIRIQLYDFFGWQVGPAKPFDICVGQCHKEKCELLLPRISGFSWLPTFFKIFLYMKMHYVDRHVLEKRACELEKYPVWIT